MKSKYQVSIEYFLFILILVALQSCSLISMTVNEKFDKVSDTLNLTLRNSQLTFPVLINDSETSLLFDTGSDSPFLYDDGVLNNNRPEKISKFGKVNNLGNELKFYRAPLRFDNELFKSNNTVFIIIPNFYAIDECSKREVTGGFYGKYFKDKILNINFEQEKLFVLNSPKNTRYIEIESKFFGLTQIQIKLNVNGRSEWFHFDTGNVLYPIILDQKSEIIRNLKHDFKVKSNRLSLIEKPNNTYFYQNNEINLGTEKVDSYMVSNDGFEEYEYNNVGIQFIKNYNWIIDYKNEKVYYNSFKDSDLNIIEAPKNNLNKCAVEDGELIIIQTLYQTESQIFKLGDQIVSVNDIPITSKNICSYSKLLNNSDWNTLTIETR